MYNTSYINDQRVWYCEEIGDWAPDVHWEPEKSPKPKDTYLERHPKPKPKSPYALGLGFFKSHWPLASHEPASSALNGPVVSQCNTALQPDLILPRHCIVRKPESMVIYIGRVRISYFIRFYYRSNIILCPCARVYLAFFYFYFWGGVGNSMDSEAYKRRFSNFDTGACCEI